MQEGQPDESAEAQLGFRRSSVDKKARRNFRMKRASGAVAGNECGGEGMDACPVSCTDLDSLEE